MASRIQIEREWADGDYVFALPIGEIRELQQKCEAGPAWVLARLQTGTWMVDDIVETIRLGLKGGGTKPDDARSLVRRYVEPYPLGDSLQLATDILKAAVESVKDEPVPKSEGEGTNESRTPLSPTEKSGSENSTG